MWPTQVIRLFEHEEVKLSDLDVSLNSREINDFQKLTRELKRQNPEQRQVLIFQYRDGVPHTIRTTSFVGVLQIGNKSIQVMPKMALEGENRDISTAISNLLFMLEYTGKVKIGSISSANLLSDKSSFYEILIFLFASNLLQILKNDFYQEYSLFKENLGYIKGKINFGNHIRLNSISQHKFFVEYDDFNENNILNQTLKLVSSLLLKASRSIQNIRLLQEISFILSDVELKTVSVEEVRRVKLNRMTSKYEYALNMCRLFLEKSSIQLATGSIKSFSFLIDMNVLFEEFIATLLRRECRIEGVTITSQRPTRPFVLHKIAESDSKTNLFMLRPDIICTSGDKVKLIVDTKYKILDRATRKEGVKQADLYQMFAYSKKYNCPNIVLLYPELPNTSFKSTEFVIDSFTSIKIVTIRLCVNLKNDHKILAAQLIHRLDLKPEMSAGADVQPSNPTTN